jgi:FkbM family methyltransferase
MKNIIYPLFRKFGFELQITPLEDTPDFSGKRFLPTRRIFLGKKLSIHDIKSFKVSYFEIFKSESYKFKSKNEVPFILDCGANIGMSVIYFKKLYPKATIIAFEPDDYIFGFLKKNMTTYGYTDVELVDKAVWIKDDILSFNSDGALGGRFAEIGESNIQKKVPTIRLRDYLIKNKIDFLKLDVEGAEYEIIKDCSDLIKDIDYIFIEYHSKPEKPQTLHEILEIIKSAGFRYHIKEAFTRKYPFISRHLNYDMDLQLNIFCYKE